ncbi:MAG: putative metal-binding motif-containing protein [Sandaracinaceae bacterium]|nr:putative metal-binding motif-containing protein [Sandaracinaceae bacterium]
MRTWLWMGLWVAGCSSAPAALDAAVDAMIGTDGGPIVMCDRDMACGDQGLFCARWRCRPGDPGTDARGCIDLGPPCEPGQGCDESIDQCAAPAWCTEGRAGCAAPGDCDNDGSRAIECGGNDCDDADNGRNPGRVEVCDAASVDEDCNPTTVAGPSDGDVDGDGSTASTCCNGSTCGEDCDDGDVNANPSASEVCNGRDDDCDGSIDTGGSLCPGGTCTAGRCAFTAWSRTFGGPVRDDGSEIAMDSAGNVYAAGIVEGEADFGAGRVAIPGAGRAVYVVRFGPDGTWNWQFVARVADGFVYTMAVAGSTVVLGGIVLGDLGSGVTAQGAFLLALSRDDGTRLWDRRFVGTAVVDDVVVDSSGILAVGSHNGTVSWGGPDRTAGGVFAGAVVRFSVTGEYVDDWPITAAGMTLRTQAVASLPAGSLVAGWYRGPAWTFGDDLPAATSDTAFLAQLDITGSPLWSRAFPTVSGGDVSIHSLVANGSSIFIGGEYSRGIDLGVDGPFSGDAIPNAFLARLDPSGLPLWARSFGSDGGTERVEDLALDSTGAVIAAGTFGSVTDLGDGSRSPEPATFGVNNGFVTVFEASGVHRRASVYSAGGSVWVGGCAVGPGDSTAIVGGFEGMTNFGDGLRISRGRDVFVLRLGS